MADIGADFVEAIASIHHGETTRFDLFGGRKVIVISDGETIEYDDDRDCPPTPVAVTTLGAVAEYVKAGILEGDLPEDYKLVHIASPSHVNIMAPLVGDYRQNFIYLASRPLLPGVIFGQYVDLEFFMIQLQSMFAHTPDRDVLLKFLGSVKMENSVQMADDGVGQSVTAKTGVIRMEEVQVNNPWVLAPFRTFPEITQPTSPFILRLDKQCRAALFEADGGAWRVQAISDIRAWLETAGVKLTILA
jgi:hypothetical protein